MQGIPDVVVTMCEHRVCSVDLHTIKCMQIYDSLFFEEMVMKRLSHLLTFRIGPHGMSLSED